MSYARRFLSTLAALALMAVPVTVAQDAPTPQRPQDVMEQAIAEMAAQVKNARIRLENNMIEMSRDARTTTARASAEDLSSGGRIGAGGKPETPPGSGKAAACCGRNVEAMTLQLLTFEDVLAEYGRRLQGNQEAMGKLMAMHRSWKEIEGGITLFNATESRDVARSALGLVAASLADFEDIHRGLLVCCVNGSRKNQQ